MTKPEKIARRIVKRRYYGSIQEGFCSSTNTHYLRIGIGDVSLKFEAETEAKCWFTAAQILCSADILSESGDHG